MGQFTELIKERDSFAGTIQYNQAVNNATLTSGSVDMSKFNRCQFIVAVSSLLPGASVNAYLQESAYPNNFQPTNIVSPGSGANPTLNSAITTANTCATLELNSTQMTKRYLSCVAGEYNVQGVGLSIIPYATDPRYPPQNSPTTSDVASVNQRIAVGF